MTRSLLLCRAMRAKRKKSEFAPLRVIARLSGMELDLESMELHPIFLCLWSHWMNLKLSSVPFTIEAIYLVHVLTCADMRNQAMKMK